VENVQKDDLMQKVSLKIPLLLWNYAQIGSLQENINALNGRLADLRTLYDDLLNTPIRNEGNKNVNYIIKSWLLTRLKKKIWNEEGEIWKWVLERN